jgi:hypothetical protein
LESEERTSVYAGDRVTYQCLTPLLNAGEAACLEMDLSHHMDDSLPQPLRTSYTRRSSQ